MSAAGMIAPSFAAKSALYKDEHTLKYLLVLTQAEASREDFDRVSNILSEYGNLKRAQSGSRIFLEEHCDALVPENALKLLAMQ